MSLNEYDESLSAQKLSWVGLANGQVWRCGTT